MKHLPAVTALTTLLSAPALAQTGAGLMLVPWQSQDQSAELKAEAFYTPTESNVGGFDVDLSIYDASGRARLSPDSSYNPTVGFDLVHYEMGSGDAALPDELTDISIAYGGSFGEVALGEALGNWQMGFIVGVGYAGTTLFEEGEAWYGKADLFAIKPIDRDTRWLIGINYDGNRVFLPDVPLPAVSYFARYNETITYAVGLPFSRVTWKPNDRWTVDLRLAVFFNATGRVSYQATDRLELFGAYIRRADAFYVSNGTDNRRFLFDQQRAELGLSYDLLDAASLTVAGGLAFGQEWDVGYDTRDPAGLRDLDDSGYLRVAVELDF